MTYTIRDSGGGLSVGTVTFNVAAVNDPPPVVNDTIRLNAGAGQTEVLTLADLPDNPDEGETLSFVLPGSEDSATTTAGGTVSIDSNGSLQYTPPSTTFTGNDTINYSVSDGSGDDRDGTLSIEIVALSERNVIIRFSSNQAESIAAAARLTGTDALGDNVEATPTVDGDNNLVFENLLPGDYEIEIPAIPFFSGGDTPQRFEINSAPEDGDMTVQSSLGRIKPEYMSMMDWLGSSLQQAAWVVVEPGQSARLTSPNAASQDSITDPVVSLNEAGTQLTINGQKDLDPSANDGDEQVSATAATSRTDIVQSRGDVGGLRLYRLNLDDGVLSYSETDSGNAAASSSLAADGNGEAELVPPPALAASGGGEGESVAAATADVRVAAPLLDIAATDPTAEDDDEAVQPPAGRLSSPTPTRRLSASSAASGQAGGATSEADHAMIGESDPAADEDTADSPLSAVGVDRFFRRIR